MGRLLVGGGGWEFYPAKKDKLRRYAEEFDFVEANVTFYKHVPLHQVKRWRRSVPDGFVFSVKCHQDVTHNLFFSDAAIASFERCLAYCEVLRAPYLVLETPASTPLSERNWQRIQDFLQSWKGQPHIVFEARGVLTKAALTGMQKMGLIHCVDASKGQKPAYSHTIFYTRIFGKGRTTFAPGCLEDHEMEEVAKYVEQQLPLHREVILGGHYLTLIRDIRRLKTRLQTGNLPPPSQPWGRLGLLNVLAAAQYPTSKQGLIREIGWAVFPDSHGRMIRVSRVIEPLPDRVYESPESIARLV